jgi:hypothetical protein
VREIRWEGIVWEDIGRADLEEKEGGRESGSLVEIFT